MGTRTAPLVFLLLAACMTTDGTQTGTGDGTPAPGPVATAPAAPVTLPAIPRMRPKAPRRQQPARATPLPAVKPTSPSTTAAPQAESADAASAAASAAGSPSPDGAGDGADAGLVPAPDLAADGIPSSDPDAAPDDAASVLSPGVGSGSAASTGEPDLPPLAAGDDWHPDADDSAAGGPAAGTEPDPAAQLAALPLPEINPGIDVESLFDGDVVRYCAAMWQMGEYIGAARRRGEPFRQAIDDAVRRIAVEKDLPLDNRLAFSGQVYGRLVYRLEDSHAALTLGTYVHFACLTVRGDKKIVPADPNAERLLNAGLMRCENTAFTRNALNDCIFRELTPIVERRND